MPKILRHKWEKTHKDAEKQLNDLFETVVLMKTHRLLGL